MDATAVGPFRILGTLGRGGMGVVYRAVHPETGEQVALKTVTALDLDSIGGIRREIHALALVRHPGVVRIVAEGIHDGLPYYAMELIRGSTLSRWAEELTRITLERPATGTEETVRFFERRRSGPSRSAVAPTARLADVRETETVPAPPPADRLPAGGGALEDFLAAVARVCAPLAFLHGEGIIHRDLKPANVIVRPDGQPVLVDFGLSAWVARGGESREALQVAGDAVGTLAYMAPEQIQGRLVDARADIYALGCILYELVTGTVPFPASSPADVVSAHLGTPPRPPSSLVEGVPKGLDALVLSMLAKDPADRIGHAGHVAVELERLGARGASTGGPPPRDYLYRARLVGRDDTLQLMVHGLTTLRQHGGRMVLIRGESGLGKTRFAMAVAEEARASGLEVVAAECPARARGERAGALSGLRPLLRHVGERCRQHGEDERKRLLGRRGRLLSTYEPSLALVPGIRDEPEPAELPPDAARRRLFGALAQTLGALGSTTPHLVVIDDLQWADELTLSFLQYVMASGHLARMPLLLVGTYRSEEPPEGIDDIVGAGALGLDLSPLHAGAIEEMVSDMLATPPPAALVTFLADHSDGNPFFVAEYLRMAVAEGLLRRTAAARWQIAVTDRVSGLPLPASLRELVTRRLLGLPSSARRAVESAAVIGRDVDGGVLEELLRMDGGDESLDSLPLLVPRQVLEATAANRYRFVHDQIREAAYAALDGPARSRLHRLAAQVLAIRGGVEPGELGRHWELAGEAARARRGYLEGARREAERHNPSAAERLYRRCLELTGRSDPESITVRIELAERVLVRRGRTREALTECEVALRDAPALGDDGLEARALEALGAVHQDEGALDAAEDSFARALAIRRSRGEAGLEGQALCAMAAINGQRGNGDAARTLGEQALSIFRRIGDRAQAGRALDALASVHYFQGRTGDARRLYGEALREARETSDLHLEELVCSHLGNLLSREWQLPASRDHYERALAIARELDDPASEAGNLYNLGCVEYDLGLAAEARARQERTLLLASELGNRRLQAYAAMSLGSYDAADGETERGEARYREALQLARGAGDPRLEAVIIGHLADLCLDTGRHAEARALFGEARALAREVGDPQIEGCQLLGLARAERLGAEDLGAARELLRRAEETFGAVGDRHQLVECLIERAYLALAEGSDAEKLVLEAEAAAQELSSSGLRKRIQALRSARP